MKPYLTDASLVCKNLATDENGISSKEVADRRQRYGENKLKEQKKVPLAVKFLKELSNPMIIVLLVAALVSGVTAWYSNEHFTDSFIILFVVVLNAVLGVFQESKAEKAIEALKEMTAATSKVIRDGKLTVIKSSEVVVGDVIVLEAGDSVPADARIIPPQVRGSSVSGSYLPDHRCCCPFVPVRSILYCFLPGR